MMNSNGKADRPEAGSSTPETALDRKIDGMTDDSEPTVKLPPAAQALIGRHLKAMYSEVVQQEVPDHLLKLLDELERKESQQ